jgi:DNA-binding transcriptional ArsR family regulator
LKPIARISPASSSSHSSRSTCAPPKRLDKPWCKCATYEATGLAALADPTRRAIFEHLAERPRAVGELASELPVSRPAVSQHLKVLKHARLVVDERLGTRRVYQVDPEGLRLLRGYLDHFWDQALAAYKTAVELPVKEKS